MLMLCYVLFCCVFLVKLAVFVFVRAIVYNANKVDLVCSIRKHVFDSSLIRINNVGYTF